MTEEVMNLLDYKPESRWSIDPTEWLEQICHRGHGEELRQDLSRFFNWRLFGEELFKDLERAEKARASGNPAWPILKGPTSRSQERPSQERPSQEPPIQEPPVQEPPIREPPIRGLPMQELPMQEYPIREFSIREPSIHEIPMQELLIRELPIRELPVREPPIRKLQSPRARDHKAQTWAGSTSVAQKHHCNSLVMANLPNHIVREALRALKRAVKRALKKSTEKSTEGPVDFFTENPFPDEFSEKFEEKFLVECAEILPENALRVRCGNPGSNHSFCKRGSDWDLTGPYGNQYSSCNSCIVACTEEA